MEQVQSKTTVTKEYSLYHKKVVYDEATGIYSIFNDGWSVGILEKSDLKALKEILNDIFYKPEETPIQQ